MGNLPACGLLAENQDQPSGLPGQDVVFEGQVDVEEAGRHGDRFGQGLNGQILDFNADRVFDLGEILACDGDPCGLVLDQEISASGEAGKMFTEIRREPIIAG